MRTLLLASLLIFSLAEGVRADSSAATVRTLPDGGVVSGLAFDSDAFQTELDSAAPPPGISVTIRGIYHQPRPDWTLTLSSGGSELVSSIRGKEALPFSFRVALSGGTTWVELAAVGPAGELERERIEIRVEDWDSLASELREEGLRRSRFSAGLTAELLLLQDSRLQNLSETGLAICGQWDKEMIRAPIDFHAGFSLTATPFGSSTDFVYRLFSASAFASYRLAHLLPLWTFEAGPGIFYETTLTSAAKGGFTGLNGPVLRITGTRAGVAGHEIWAALSLAAISGSGISLLPLGTHAIGLEAEYRTNFPESERSLALGADFHTLSFLSEEGVSIRQQSFGLYGRIGL